MKTFVSFILDESGSMQSCKEQVLSGYKEYLQSFPKKDKNKIRFTLTKFSRLDLGSVVCRVGPKDVTLDKVKALDGKTYRPNGTTPLLDAVGKTVNFLRDCVKEKDRAIVVIMTDGYENASIEYKKEAIRKMIEELQAKKNWSFVFMGADQDAFAEASQIGVPKGNTMSYNSVKTKEAFHSLSCSNRAYTGSEVMGVSSFFHQDDEEGSGKKFSSSAD